MRRHDTQTSGTSGTEAGRSRARVPTLQALAGNRAVAGLLAPRSVQRAPATPTLEHPDEIDYWNLKHPKSLDANFTPLHGDTGSPDVGFTPPRRPRDGLDLGYGHSGDAGFRPDYRKQGGRASGGLDSLAGAMAGNDPLGRTLPHDADLPIPPPGLPVPGGDDPDLAGAAKDIGAAAVQGFSSFAKEIPFVGDEL
jgi:hypothetical protein